MRPRETREVWAKRVQRWGDSGLTAKEFAAEVGINASTLTYWKCRLRRETRGGPGRSGRVKPRRARRARTRRRRAPPSKPKPGPTVEFLEVPGVPAEMRVEIHLRCGRRVLVPTTLGAKAVAELADLLEHQG